MEDWAFTLKTLNRYQDICRIRTKYHNVLDEWRRMDCKIKYWEEHTDTLIPHLHGVVSIPIRLLRKKLCLRGYHVKLVELLEPEVWLRYCRKNKCTPRMIEKIQNLENEIVYNPTEADLEELAEYQREQQQDHAENHR